MNTSNSIRFKDLTNDAILPLEDLSQINGGSDKIENVTDLTDGCSSQICENKRSYGNEHFCLMATCTSGIGTCTNSTD